MPIASFILRLKGAEQPIWMKLSNCFEFEQTAPGMMAMFRSKAA
jgi:hypothetical protein